jgi:hypothetical protein
VHSDLHIQENDGQLDIFLLKRRKGQPYSPRLILSYYLLRWLMMDTTTNRADRLDPRALLTVQKILKTSPSGLDYVLEKDGIATCSIEDLNQVMQSDRDSKSESSTDGEGSTRPAETSYSTHHNNSAVGNEEAPPYCKALHNIVLAARSSNVPFKGAFDMSPMTCALNGTEYHDPRGFFTGLNYDRAFDGASLLERDRKIRAAGELYVRIDHIISKMPWLLFPWYGDTIR